MAKIDRNKLALEQTVAWWNHGWVEGVIKDVVQGARKVMYLVKPGYGLEEFGGASHTTGWKQSIVNADCLMALRCGGPLDELTPADPEFVYGDAKEWLTGNLKTIPEVVPQDRNMFREWKEQQRADKVCVESPDEKDERLARERSEGTAPTSRTRSRTLPSEEDAPLNQKGVPADVGMTPNHFPKGMKHEYVSTMPVVAPAKRQRARTATPVSEQPPAPPAAPVPRQRVRTR